MRAPKEIMAAPAQKEASIIRGMSISTGRAYEASAPDSKYLYELKEKKKEAESSGLSENIKFRYCGCLHMLLEDQK
jgi:hypothetical protein